MKSINVVVAQFEPKDGDKERSVSTSSLLLRILPRENVLTL